MAKYILLYADDIILLSENEEDLQTMLTCVAEWCKKVETLYKSIKDTSYAFLKTRKRKE